MKKFVFLCTIIALICMCTVVEACIIADASFFASLAAILVNMGALFLAYCSDKPKTKDAHQVHYFYAYNTWFCIGVVGLTCLVLDTMVGWFGDVVMLLICASVIWMCSVRLADNDKTKVLWWIGWIVTMFIMSVLSLLDLLKIAGADISENLILGFLLTDFGLFALTVLVGCKLYVYPKIKKISDIIKDIKH